MAKTMADGVAVGVAMAAPEARWQRFTTAFAGRLDGGQIADLLWMAQLLAPQIRLPESQRFGGPDEAPPADQPADTPAADPASQQERSDADSLSTSEQEAAPAPSPPAALVEPASGAADPPTPSTPRVGVAEAGLLRHPRQIARALAPLSRRVPAGPACLLDVPATVEAIARARLEECPWSPVLRPRLEPWLSLQLLFDRHSSMALWERLRWELPRTLRREVRWRDLRQWSLAPGVDGRLGLRDRQGRPCAPGRLRQLGDRQLLLLVSDAVAPAWRDGRVAALLGSWAERQPLLLLQVLPQRLWSRTGLGQQEAGWVEARRPLQPNPQLRWQPFDSDPFAPPPNPAPDSAASLVTPQPAAPPLGAPQLAEPQLAAPQRAAAPLTLPLVTLELEDLAAMARLLEGRAGESLRGFRWKLPAGRPSPDPAPLPASEPSAAQPPLAQPPLAEPPAAASAEAIERQLALFLFSASPRARRLLALLSFAPVITLPVVRLLQRQVPGSGPTQLAEVLFSGLFRNAAPPTSSPTAPGGGGRRIPVDRQRLSFVDDSLRLRLREGLRVREARAVYEEVSRHVRESLNLSVEEFEAILKQAPSAPASQDPALLEAFAMLAPSCLRGLGRRYEQLADEIERAARQPLPPPGPTAEDLLALEGVSFATAWLEELPLQRIPFQSAVLQEGTIRRFANQCWGYAEPLAAEGQEAVPLTMVEIPAGKVLLGSPVDEKERSDDEGPRHEVQLQGFFISQAPITQAQWRAVANWQERPTERWGRELKPNPSRFRGDQAELFPSEGSSDQRPVEQVSWHEAMEFCQRLSQRTGRCYTLPSEAQWEYACRAGSNTPFHFGTNLVGRFRYSFAVSYPGSLRPLVEPIVALMLAACNQDQRRLLYDSFQREMYADAGLAEGLAEVYLSCDCVVVFLSKDYLETATNQLEWLALKPLRDDPRDRARVLLLWCGERDDRLLATLGLDLAQDRVHCVEDLGPAAIWDLIQARSLAEGLIASKSGEPLAHSLANYNGAYSYNNGPKTVAQNQTTPVGMFPANEWGLHDTHGNVWEWCLDHWHHNYKGAPTDGSAWLEPDALPEPSRNVSQASIEDARPRLLRGGSWYFFPGGCRSACRFHFRPDYAYGDVGFRVVCLPQDPSLNP